MVSFTSYSHFIPHLSPLYIYIYKSGSNAFYHIGYSFLVGFTRLSVIPTTITLQSLKKAALSFI